MTRTRTDITEQLVGDYARLLDFLTRVVNASDVRYLHEKIGQLRGAADHMANRLSANGLQADMTKTFDPRELAAGVAREARHYRAGRLLYPLGGDPAAAAAAAALTSAATALQYGMPVDGISPAHADALAAWLRARADEQLPAS